MSVIAVNIRRVRERMFAACARVGRNPLSVRLIAVSKTHSIAKVQEAFAAGQIRFGENYLQEAEPKIAALPDAEWHFIGSVQSNKVKGMVGRFELIHSVDRDSVLQMISKKAVERGVMQKILLEVNLGDEASKGGVSVTDAREFIQRARHLPGVQLSGLMGMPPPSSSESARPFFRRLRRIFEENAAEGFVELSMGTTQDFEVAIEEGATLIRIGTEIFGVRSREI